MSWTLKGKAQADKVSLGTLNNSCVIAGEAGGSWYITGYPASTGESYYRVKNGRLNASIIIPETTVWNSNPSAGDWLLVASETTLPRPKDVGTAWTVYGYAQHSTFGGQGTDFLMEYESTRMSPTYVCFKFLVANQGFISILGESNKNTYLKQFFGTYGGISINLEYPI